MSSLPPPVPTAPPPDRTLRRLFLTLFLRGRTSRGLRKDGAPASVGRKLALSLLFYGLFGCLALGFLGQPVFGLSVYLHGLTFVFLGMFVAASAGEVLFNREESDILLHRPVTPRDLLRAKIAVLVQVSLWIAGAFNLAGLLGGTLGPRGHWSFFPAHLASTALEAVFCTGSVVLAYQLCLRWFSRERLEGFMTTAQVMVSVGAVVAGQLFPRVMMRIQAPSGIDAAHWWIALLPPAWFAGFDDAISGSREASSWILAGLGVAATALVLRMSFGTLAADYERGLQTIAMGPGAAVPKGGGRRWIATLAAVPPLSWWLRDPVARASFVLVGAYLMRDRDMKLRVFPGLAPILVMPLVFLFQDPGQGTGMAGGGFGMAFAGGYVGLVPMIALGLVRYSQHWQAADVFRTAPIAGPASLAAGARVAVVCFLALPVLAAYVAIACLVRGADSTLPMMLPGLVAMPVYAMVPAVGAGALPLALPGEEAKSAGRGLAMLGAMLASLALGGLALWARHGGWFGWMLLGESLVAAAACLILRAAARRTRWDPTE